MMMTSLARSSATSILSRHCRPRLQCRSATAATTKSAKNDTGKRRLFPSSTSSTTTTTSNVESQPTFDLDLSGVPPVSFPFIVVGMRNQASWIVVKSRGEDYDELFTEEKDADEEEVVRNYHVAFTVTDLSEKDCRNDHKKREQEQGGAPEGNVVPHIAVFESKMLAHWVRVAISADPSWRAAQLRRVSLPRLVQVCDAFGVPRVALFQTGFFRGITCQKL